MSTLREKIELSIADQAAQWLCELGDESQDRRAEFVAWLRESPRHVEEFLLTTAVWKSFDEAGPKDADRVAGIITEALTQETSPNVVAIAPSPLSSPAKEAALSGKDRINRWSIGIAAAVALLAVGMILAARLPFTAHSYATGIGEQRAFRLPDSSIVYLNAQSRVEVRFSDHARELDLLAGEALFTVARDRARPFRVRAGSSMIQALGTQFNVYRQAAITTVSVLEGAVQILASSDGAASSTATSPSSSSPSRISAGEQASIAPNGTVVRQVKKEVADAVAWRERRVVFRGKRLEDIAAEFARYSPRRIRVEGDLARNKRLTASFAADDPESLMLFLAKEHELRVEPEGEGFVVRSRD